MTNTTTPVWLQEMLPFAKAAWKQSQFSQPTTIQNESIPLVLEGKDVIAEAPTGSGKTLAYLLPMLQSIDTNKKHTQVLILASSHELVMQIHQEVQTWSKNSGVQSATLIGGANVKRQIEKLKKKPQLVIGTPGRVFELMQKKKLKAHEIKTIVLDEADQLLVPEHIKMVQNIIKSTLKERQILLYSATLPEEVEKTASEFMKSPKIVRVKEEAQKPDVEHLYIPCEDRDKVEVLRKLAHTDHFKGLAFMRDIGNLNVYAEKLRYKGIDLGVLHSDAKKEQRAKALRGYRNGEYHLLLATDVAARGIDIQDITHIVNFDVPKDFSSYVHRAGRTARVGSSSGVVISLVNPVEEKRLKKIARDHDFPLMRSEIIKGKLQYR
ncbi:putative ATP-dependent RNA helicase YfmL [Halobacillus andaensis]|uniref:ATP-dependent RNA helicase YfmL n=1 Tax=Halobacillus andaensis TaxID=1176239 RepID=A0A917EW32_HALAA|nr:DEAD/DEAH box helicase [Halobacillus andaensis]MBP2004606.1 superfamily II DNA/RNA helicase [Halobacillus andaensis]GGF20360.1 putative ATP-dependent RNA helicase YfmL [Halobacillus andaensis]